MTNPNLTSINVIIDESPSMRSLTDATIEGFNAFLAEQQLQPTPAKFSLTKFHGHASLICDQIPLTEAKPLNRDSYRPSGSGTALLDAVGLTVEATGRKLAALREEDRPGKVIFVIMTDGEENMSSKYSKEQIQQMVQHQQDVYAWEFVFMGAGVDAFSGGTAIGIRGVNTFSYNHDAVAAAASYGTLSSNMNSYRSVANHASQVDFFNQQQGVGGAGGLVVKGADTVVVQPQILITGK